MPERRRVGEVVQLTDLTPDLLVAALGTTPAEIAATLANKGIVGRIGKYGDCPLARYLRGQGYDNWTDGAAHVGYHSMWGEGVPHAVWEYRLPDAAAAFARKFDDREYPDLVDWG